MVVAFKYGLGAGIGQAFCHLELTCRTRLITLLFHCGIESGQIDINVALPTNIGSQVNRESISVIQREQCLPVKNLARAVGRLGGG